MLVCKLKSLKHAVSWTCKDLTRKVSRVDTAGTFRVWLYQSNGGDPHLIHDRKSEGGFAEMKVLVSGIACIV